MDKKWIAATAILLLAIPANAGEIIGNTYIGEKHGYIEIQSPGGKWRIEDQEGQGTNIAKLTLKDAISGMRPSIQFFGVLKQGDVAADQVAQWGRETAQKNGAELGPTEIKRFSGKQVLTYSGTVTKGNQRVMFLWFVLEGPKVFFQVTAAANALAYDAAKPLFDEVIEKLKY